MAGRKLYVEVIGDASSLQRSLQRAALSTNTLGRATKSLSVDVNTTARVQVKAAVESDRRLRQQIQAYRSLAAASRKGSAEQKHAAEFAAAAERKLARSVGITAREQRALSLSSSHAERNLGRATRGALAGSGVFRGLGRSIAFASGGFLAFASVSQFLRASIDATKEMQVTQKQLAAQFRASGKDLNVYEGQIDQTGNRLGLLAGFENDEVKRAFVTIFRVTQNVSKGLRDTSLAADIARARHMDLSRAATLVAKVEAGNVGLLRRNGVQIAKNATVEEALTVARRRFAGQAKAGTTAQERFGAVLHNTEEIIGAGILPILNRYLSRASVWLTQMNESGRLQKDVASATGLMGDAIAAIRKVLTPAINAFKNLNKFTGSSKRTLELLAGAFVAFKVAGIIGKLAKLAAAFRDLAAAEAAAAGFEGLAAAGAGAAGGFGAAAGFAAGAGAGGAAGLLARFAGRVAPLGPFAVGAGILAGISLTASASAKKTIAMMGLQPFAKVGKQVVYLNPHDNGRYKFVTVDSDGSVHAFDPESVPSGTKGGAPVRGTDFPRGAGVVFPTTTRAGKPLSLQGQFNLAELRLAQAQLTKTMADDRAILVVESAILQKQIEHVKKLKDRTELTQQLAGVLSQIRSIDEDAANQAKEAAKAEKERLKAAREHAALLRQQKQFRALGLDISGGPFIPGVKGLRTQLSQISTAISGTFLDTKKTQSLLARIRKVLSGALGAMSKDVRSTVKQMLDDLNQQLKEGGTGPQTKFAKANTDKILAGLGLTGDQIKALQARLSQMGAGGTIKVPQTQPAFAGGFGGQTIQAGKRVAIQPQTQPAFAGGFGGQTIVFHSHVDLDGREVATNTTRHQQKAVRRNPSQRRGPHAGGGL